MSKSAPRRSDINADAADLAHLQHVLRPVGIKQAGQQATADQPRSPTHTAGAGRPAGSPFQANSHEHASALVAGLSSPQKQLLNRKAATTGTPSTPDSPLQHTYNQQQRLLADAQTQGIMAPTQTPTHTPVQHDFPYHPTSRSHVAALAGQILERLQSGDSMRSNSSSLAPDSPYRANSSSHVHEMINAYQQAVAADSSPIASPPRVSAAGPQAPHNTPLAPSSEQVRPFAAYRPKLVGPDDPVQGPQIIHISYGREAPFKSRTSHVAQLADQFVAAKAAEDVGPHGTTPNSSSSGDPGAGTSGKPAANLAVNTAKDRIGPSPSPPSPRWGQSPNQRLRSPRSKSQLFAPSKSNNTVQAAKARLSHIAAGECTGVKVSSRAGSYLAEVAAANVTVGDASADGANMNPLYDLSTLGYGALTESMLSADEIAHLSINDKSKQ